MKILVLANDFPTKNNEYTGLIFVKEQVRELAKYSEEINVVVPIPRGIEKYREYSYGVKGIKYEDYTIGDNVKIHFVKYWNPLFPLTFYRFRGEWVYVEARAVMHFLEKSGIKFDIIHAHYSWPCGALGVKIKDRYKVPLVVTEHTSRTFNKYISSQDSLIRETWQRADAIIRVRKNDINLFSKLGISLDKIYYIPNGFDAGKFYPISKEVARMKVNLPLNTKIILNVAKMYDPVKGHEYLLRAYSKVAKSCSNTLLVLIGDGKLMPSLKGLSETLNIKTQVSFVGAKQHEEIPLWMNAADLFVLPSLSEGNPTVMFEALGVGLPFVGTAVGGVPEVIVSEDYGLLCPPADPECLAKKILIALEKEWDREKIRKYAEQFTWENIAKKIIEIYEKVIGGH